MANKEAPSILEILGKSAKDENETLAGYIHLIEEGLNDLQKEDDSDDGVSTFTLRLPNKLNNRFQKACSVHRETKSKILRSLIEFYIVEVESQLRTNPINKIFELSADEQLQKLSELTEGDLSIYFKIKKERAEKNKKAEAINKGKI